ncbi:MAG: TonB-dependent siderophore receptor [Burkholderia sp.]
MYIRFRFPAWIGFPLCFAVVSPHAIAQTGSGPAARATLAPVSVSASSETADGPVKGYRATRTGTATRTDAALRDVPQSINVVPRQVIDDQHDLSLNEALRNVSGVQAGSNFGGRSESAYIRGFSAPIYATDGVLFNRALSFAQNATDLANAERVEVLKGPASVLYGQGMPGGMINIVTRAPRFKPAASLDVEGGSDGYARTQFDLTGPIGKQGKLAYRLDGALQRDGGWQDNVHRSDREFISGSVLWLPTDSTTVRFDFSHTSSETPFYRGLLAQGDGVSLPRSTYTGENWANNVSHDNAATLRIEQQVADWLAVRQISHVDWGETDRLTADVRSLSANNQTVTRRAQRMPQQSFSVDEMLDATASFATGSVKHAVTLGVEYEHGRRGYDTYAGTLAGLNLYRPEYGAVPGAMALSEAQTSIVDTGSVYLQDQIALGRYVKLLGGVRADVFDQTVRNDIAQSQARTSGAAYSPRLGLVWQPRDDLAVFTGWSRSFSPQAGTTRLGQAYAPEHGEQVEAGVKWDPTPDLSATLAVYRIVRDNVLATDPVDSNYNVQTGQQRSRGVELDIAGTLLPGWRTIVSSAYTDAEVSQDTTYLAGTRLPAIPAWSGSVWSTYEIQRGVLRGLRMGAGAFAVSRRNGDLNSSFHVGGYVRVDASLSYPITRKVRLTFTAKNLFDADYVETPVARTEIYPGAPRSFIAGLHVEM